MKLKPNMNSWIIVDKQPNHSGLDIDHPDSQFFQARVFDMTWGYDDRRFGDELRGGVAVGEIWQKLFEVW